MRAAAAKATLLVFAPSASAGGPMRYLEEGLPSIAEAWGEHVVVAVPATSVPALGKIAGDKVEVIGLRTGRGGRAAHFVRSQVEAIKLRRTYRPAVTYCLGNVAYVGPRAASVTLIQNAARRRDLHHPARSLSLYLRIVAATVAVSAIRSRRLIAVSEYTKSLVPTSRGRRRTDVVHHGVRHVRSGVAVDPPAPRDALRVTVAGSIYSYKGVELAIEAIARCTRRRWELRVAGPVMEPSYDAYLRRVAGERGVDGQVCWLGPMAHEALLSEIGTADVYLTVSRAEACPNVLLEAAVVRPDRPIVGVTFPWNEEYDELFDARCPADELARLLDEIPLESSPTVVQRRRDAIASYQWPATAAATVSVLRAAAGVPALSAAVRRGGR